MDETASWSGRDAEVKGIGWGRRIEKRENMKGIVGKE